LTLFVDRTRKRGIEATRGGAVMCKECGCEKQADTDSE